jgi:hypothetical protein
MPWVAVSISIHGDITLSPHGFPPLTILFYESPGINVQGVTGPLGR